MKKQPQEISPKDLAINKAVRELFKATCAVIKALDYAGVKHDQDGVSSLRIVNQTLNDLAYSMQSINNLRDKNI